MTKISAQLTLKWRPKFQPPTSSTSAIQIRTTSAGASRRGARPWWCACFRGSSSEVPTFRSERWLTRFQWQRWTLPPPPSRSPSPGEGRRRSKSIDLKGVQSGDSKDLKTKKWVIIRMADNTHHRGNYHLTARLQFNWIGSYQTRKYVINCM